MTTSILKEQILRGVKLVTILPLTINGDISSPASQPLRFYGISDVPIQMLIDQGERIVDKADGVGVIAIHEEDDTLLGAEFSMTATHTNLHLFQELMNGKSLLNNDSNIISWTSPTIQEQRDNPKRFQVDIYVQTLSGAYFKHCFFYCRGMLNGLSHAILKFAEPSFTFKARPHPINQRAHEITLVQEIPTF